MAEEMEIDIELSADILVEANSYSIKTNIDEGKMCIQFYNEEGVLSSLTTDSVGAFDFAQRVLRGYDHMEGIGPS